LSSTNALAAVKFETFFENHRGSGAVSFFSNFFTWQQQLFSRDGYICFQGINI